MRVLKISAALGAAFSAAVLLAACDGQKADLRKPAARDWPLNGGDWNNSRFSALDQINTDNVKTLGAAWMVKLGGASNPNAGGAPGAGFDTVRGSGVVAGGKL